MDRKKLRNLIMLMLCACMAVSPMYNTSSDGSEPSDTSVSRGIVRIGPDSESCQAQINFAVELLRQNFEQKGGNICVAPLSLYSLLAAVQNGAAGDTLSQMNDILGGDAEKINGYMSWYADSLRQTDLLRSANSLWITDNTDMFLPDAAFIDTVSEAFDAEVFSRPFPPSECSGTVKDINDWASDSTDGMITKLLDNIPDDAIMYIINAVSFDARWEEQYTVDKLGTLPFTAADGSSKDADMMFSTEHIFIHDEDAVGFIKPYAGGRYSFAAILPNEDITIDEYISRLSGKSLAKLLASAEEKDVTAAMPKFDIEYELEQNETLKAMGMVDAFSDCTADFSAMGHCPDNSTVYISRVMHKTHIAVDEDGTRAGAASAAEMMMKTAIMHTEYVYLDRPFVYAVIDSQTAAPVFIGTVCSL